MVEVDIRPEAPHIPITHTLGVPEDDDDKEEDDDDEDEVNEDEVVAVDVEVEAIIVDSPPPHAASTIGRLALIVPLSDRDGSYNLPRL